MPNIRGQSTATIGAVDAKGTVAWDAGWCCGCGKFGFLQDQDVNVIIISKGSQFRDLDSETIDVDLQYREAVGLVWSLNLSTHWDDA